VSRMSRDKGARGERVFCQHLHAAGWPAACRNLEQTRDGGFDVVGGPAAVDFEVRCRETWRVAEWMREITGRARPGVLPVLVVKRNRESFYAVLELDELLALLALREGVR
jgi:hypothetical protein